MTKNVLCLVNLNDIAITKMLYSSTGLVAFHQNWATCFYNSCLDAMRRISFISQIFCIEVKAAGLHLITNYHIFWSVMLKSIDRRESLRTTLDDDLQLTTWSQTGVGHIGRCRISFAWKSRKWLEPNKGKVETNKWTVTKMYQIKLIGLDSWERE